MMKKLQAAKKEMAKAWWYYMNGVHEMAKTLNREPTEQEINDAWNEHMEAQKTASNAEKLIKKVFVNYNALVKREKICPILLFNEADAIFLKRKTGELRGAENALNAMQNIILEEMENFKGILIATTNLVRNLDPAFERRFLFKIRLSNPTPEVKQKIWADRLPRFSESEFEEIATKFDFSGGEIDNIVRKISISEIIEGTIPTLPLLDALCLQEKFERNPRRPIGFKQVK